jgi:hypothetical protein
MCKYAFPSMEFTPQRIYRVPSISTHINGSSKSNVMKINKIHSITFWQRGTGSYYRVVFEHKNYSQGNFFGS